MNVEAYSVSFDKINYHASVGKGINPAEAFRARENEIRDNMLRYVGEFRLGVKFDEFYYRVEKDLETGENHFASKKTGPIRNIYRNAIYDRESKGASIRREVAECLGFEKLEKGLLAASIGTMAVWVSPPGKRSEGYGNYSFTFLAQVEDGENGRNIRMIPYRNEFSLEEHNAYLSKLTKRNIEFQKDTQFLSTPFIIEKNEELQTPEDLLIALGEEERFDDSWREEVETALRPYVDWFMYLVKNNASDEKLIEVRNIIENLTIAYKEDKELVLQEMTINEEIKIEDNFYSRREIIQRWSYEPPKVAGSCPIPVGGQEISVATPMEFQQLLNPSGEKDCPEIKCKKCPWKANEGEVKKINDRKLTKCPKCGWKP